MFVIRKKDVLYQFGVVEELTGRNVQYEIDNNRYSAWFAQERGKPLVSLCAGRGARDAWNQILAFIRGWYAATETLKR